MAESKSQNSAGGVTVTLSPYETIRKATMGETYQYFNKLIATRSIQNLDECTDSSCKLSLFDESLQFMLIDSLQCEKEVLKILLSQNERQIKRVLGCKWFFQNLSADFCTQHIFPNVSFSLRCKIINRLSRHLESADEAEKYFTFITENYDNARANFMLPKCSAKFILDYVNREKPQFDDHTGPRIIKNISKRYPEIGVHILSTVFDMKKEKSYSYIDYAKTILHLAGYHPDLMIPLFKKNLFVIPYEFFGKKLTKKLVRKLQGDLFPKFMEHLIFKEKTLFSIIGFEDQVKFLANIVHSYSSDLSSRNWSESDQNLAILLKLVPQDKRLEMINRACKEVYKLNFDEYPKCWSPQVLETLPTETRTPYIAKLEEFAEAGLHVYRQNVECNFFYPNKPESYLYLYDSRVAFDKCRKILQKPTAVMRRQTILEQLVKSCWINKDPKVLEEIVEFVTTRHRNDDHNVIYRFMEAISDHFPVSALNSTIFEKLDDLAYFCYTKDRKDDHVYNRWMERHIYHRLENGLDVDNHVKRFFEYFGASRCYFTFVHNFQTKHSKLLVLLLCKEAVCWIKNGSAKDEPEENSMIRRLLDTCMEYNKLNRSKLFLREIPGSEEILQKKIKATYGGAGWEEWPPDIWDRYYDEVTSAYHKPRSLLYTFKRRPDLIEKHLHGILNIMFYEYFREYNAFLIFLMKTVSFFGKTEKMKELILNEFQNGKSLGERKIALLLYSYNCTIDEFRRVTESYLPKREKLDRGSDEAFDEIQMYVPRLIKNIKPRHKNLQFVLKFFMGDFLKSVLSSFYSCCYNTRCDFIIPFLNKHLEEVPERVSYVKDIIRLILLLSGRNERAEFCLRCWDEHKHYTVRSTLLHFVSRLFLDERTQKSFQIMEKCILDCDDMTIEPLPELNKIPEEFLNDYVNALWRFSDCQKSNFRANFRKTILSGFTEKNVGFLSKELCESIIKSHLFDKSAEIAVDDFAAVYLSVKSEDVENRALVVLNVIKDRKPDAESVYSFFDILIGKSKENPSDFADLFTVILKNWPEYPLGVLHEQRVLFTYHNLYQGVLTRGGDGEKAFVEFGRELKKLFASVEHLNDLLPIYVECLKHFLGDYKTPKAILALKELVTGTVYKVVAVLAVLCMPDEAVEWYKMEGLIVQEYIVSSRKVLKEFVRILGGCGDRIVEIYLRSKFQVVNCDRFSDVTDEEMHDIV